MNLVLRRIKPDTDNHDHYEYESKMRIREDEDRELLTCRISTVGWTWLLQKSALESQIMEKKNQKRLEKQEFRSHFQEWCGDESNPSTGTLRSLAKGVTNGEFVPCATYIRHSKVPDLSTGSFLETCPCTVDPNFQTQKSPVRAYDSRQGPRLTENGQNQNVSKSSRKVSFRMTSGSIQLI